MSEQYVVIEANPAMPDAQYVAKTGPRNSIIDYLLLMKGESFLGHVKGVFKLEEDAENEVDQWINPEKTEVLITTYTSPFTVIARAKVIVELDAESKEQAWRTANEMIVDAYHQLIDKLKFSVVKGHRPDPKAGILDCTGCGLGMDSGEDCCRLMKGQLLEDGSFAGSQIVGHYCARCVSDADF